MTRSASPQPAAPTPSPRREGDDSRAVAVTAAAGGILGVLAALVGVGMLVAKAFGAHPWPVISQIPLLMLPVAFLLLMAALILAVRRRRRV
ncbi:MYXO-CTERM domain-containing protein [Kocuria sp. AG109]|uniref:hypothetical protein n=1 Tax=Rothia kristinae TaxID=37923 RepID=UPI00077483A5|nr:hypothetical protein [Rothia kristinae]MCA1170296.1 hypothetical protein [Rothia kristinae]TDP56019.1 MYXO-CTERM domain-containing protein [Kocuria sp. AG109]